MYFLFDFEMDRIIDLQHEFDELISKDGTDLSYAYTVAPFCKRALEILGDDPFKWPIQVNEYRIIDIYYETLYHWWTLHVGKPFPFKLLVLLMVYRPFIYYVVAMTKTYDELAGLISRINEQIDLIFKKNLDNERVVKLKQIMNLKRIDPTKLSSIAYLHYLIGFQFMKNMIGVNKETVMNAAHDNHANVIYVNVLHNLPYHDKEVYVYREIQDRIGFKFLTPEIAERYRPIALTEISKDYQRSKRFVYDEITECNMFVLDYNGNDFTILTKDDKPYLFNKKNATRFMNGAIPMLITNETFINYAEQMYNESIHRVFSSEKVIDIEIPRFASLFNECIRSILDESEIINKLQLSKFCDRLDQSLDGKMDVLDRSLFVFYCRLYNWSGEMDKHMFVEYMKGYFDPVE